MTTGLSDGDTVEITEGLSEGDKIYYQKTGNLSQQGFGGMGAGFRDGMGEMPGGGPGGAMGEMPDPYTQRHDSHVPEGRLLELSLRFPYFQWSRPRWNMIQLQQVSKIYEMGTDRVYALDHADMEIKEGEFVSIVGPSGSGKSTMMNIIGCLDTADEGAYILDGISVERYSEKELAKILL